MKYRQKLTPEQGDELIRLFEDEGWTVLQLVARFPLTESAVNYRLLRAGLDPWPKGGGQVKRRECGGFSPEEDARMLALGAEGKSPYQIHKIIGRPRTSVLIRILTLEVRAEKALEAA
jgi:hypothetical protein